MSLGLAFPLSQTILQELMQVPNVLRAASAGSLRRMRETMRPGFPRRADEAGR